MGRQIDLQVSTTTAITRRTRLSSRVGSSSRTRSSPTVGQLGTEPVQAARAYLNQQKVPQVLVADGSLLLGYAVQGVPVDHRLPARLHRRRSLSTDSTSRRTQRGKKIAMLYQNDDYGKDYLYGLRSALGKSVCRCQHRRAGGGQPPGRRVLRHRWRASGQAVLRSWSIFALPGPTITTYATGKALDFNPDQIYLNSVSATAAFLNIAVQRAGADYVNGSISIGYLKDPSNPAQNRDAALQEYRRIIAKYAPTANASNGLYVYGFALADTFVQAMYKAGKSPTRASLMNALAEPELRPIASRSRASSEDEQDGPLCHQPDAAPALQQRHLVAVRLSRRGSPALEASPLRVTGGRGRGTGPYCVRSPYCSQ